MKRGALYIRHVKRGIAERTPTTRCRRCGRHYVHIDAHMPKCKAPERQPNPPRKSLEEIDATLRIIAWKHGMTLEDLKGASRSRTATEARRACYRYLREQEDFTVLAVATHFNRHERTVAQALSPFTDERRAYYKSYMREWRAKREQAA